MPWEKRTAGPARRGENYKHPRSTNPMRPDVGTQAQFRKKRPPATHRYDSSLSPALEWDEENPVGQPRYRVSDRVRRRAWRRRESAARAKAGMQSLDTH